MVGNQFGAQEPGSNAEVKDFAIKKGLSKVLFAKIDVNGPAAHPLYVKLKKDASNKTLLSMLGDDIKWNFGKFLISNGKTITRLCPFESPRTLTHAHTHPARERDEIRIWSTCHSISVGGGGSNPIK